MPSNIDLIQQLYDRFNARDIEAVLAMMHPNVVWANGLEGGHVHGRDGVRNYWTRQWATMNTRAEPIHLSTAEDGTIRVEAHLTGRDLDGNPLFDAKGHHVFHIDGGLITRFDIL